MNTIHAQVTAFCRANNICTACKARRPKKDCVQCEACLERKRNEKLRNRQAYLAKSKVYYQENRERKIKYKADYTAKNKKILDIQKAVKAVSKL